MSCQNNLKQLGLALCLYEVDHGKFPPGQVIGPLPEAGVPLPVAHGWAPFILRHIEQDNLASSYRWDLENTAPANQAAVIRRLKVFQCPSAPEQDRYYYGGPFARYGGKAACGDYGPIWGVDTALANRRWITSPSDCPYFIRGWPNAIPDLWVYPGVMVPNQMTRVSQNPRRHLNHPPAQRRCRPAPAVAGGPAGPGPDGYRWTLGSLFQRVYCSRIEC